MVEQTDCLCAQIAILYYQAHIGPSIKLTEEAAKHHDVIEVPLGSWSSSSDKTRFYMFVLSS
jgi:hypothetical protein